MKYERKRAADGCGALCPWMQDRNVWIHGSPARRFQKQTKNNLGSTPPLLFSIACPLRSGSIRSYTALYGSSPDQTQVFRRERERENAGAGGRGVEDVLPSPRRLSYSTAVTDVEESSAGVWTMLPNKAAASKIRPMVLLSSHGLSWPASRHHGR